MDLNFGVDFDTFDDGESEMSDTGVNFECPMESDVNQEATPLQWSAVPVEFGSLQVKVVDVQATIYHRFIQEMNIFFAKWTLKSTQYLVVHILRYPLRMYLRVMTFGITSLLS